MGTVRTDTARRRTDTDRRLHLVSGPPPDMGIGTALPKASIIVICDCMAEPERIDASISRPQPGITAPTDTEADTEPDTGDIDRHEGWDAAEGSNFRNESYALQSPQDGSHRVSALLAISRKQVTSPFNEFYSQGANLCVQLVSLVGAAR